MTISDVPSEAEIFVHIYYSMLNEGANVRTMYKKSFSRKFLKNNNHVNSVLFFDDPDRYDMSNKVEVVSFHDEIVSNGMRMLLVVNGCAGKSQFCQTFYLAKVGVKWFVQKDIVCLLDVAKQPASLSENKAIVEKSEATTNNCFLDDIKTSLIKSTAENLGAAASNANKEREKGLKSRVCLIYNKRMMDHKSKKKAFENPSRIKVIMKKLDADGLSKRCDLLLSERANDEDILMVHFEDYFNIVLMLPLSRDQRKIYESYLGDVFYSAGTPTAALLAAGSVVQAVKVVLDGLYDAAFAICRPPGHHATQQRADGFCWLNNVAIGAEYAISKKNLLNVAILDIDIHHCDGTQDIFYQRNDVLVFSIHSSGLKFPHDEKVLLNRSALCIGEGVGMGYNINANLSAGYGDADIMMVLDDLFIPIANEFKPQLIIISVGYDAASGDPTGDAELTESCYGRIVNKVRQVNTGRLVLALEGGYNLNVIPGCASSTVKALLGDPEDSYEENEPLPSTVTNVSELKNLLSPFWLL